jgi:ubiquinone/menaquinone biosynthesis C-methylase UbiE
VDKEFCQIALDIGCGRGNSTSFIPKSTHLVIAVDNCFEMLSRNTTVFPMVSFINTDAVNLPFQSQSFHLILCIGVSEYLDNISKLLSEIERVLIPQGYIIITISNKNILNYLRLLLGHHLYPINDTSFETMLSNYPFKMVAKLKTALQFQYLLQKVSNIRDEG